MGIAGG
jgi:hypothetical protein